MFMLVSPQNYKKSFTFLCTKNYEKASIEIFQFFKISNLTNGEIADG